MGASLGEKGASFNFEDIVSPIRATPAPTVQPKSRMSRMHSDPSMSMSLSVSAHSNGLGPSPKAGGGGSRKPPVSRNRHIRSGMRPCSPGVSVMEN